MRAHTGTQTRTVTWEHTVRKADNDAALRLKGKAVPESRQRQQQDT